MLLEMPESISFFTAAVLQSLPFLLLLSWADPGWAHTDSPPRAGETRLLRWLLIPVISDKRKIQM